tara:strand:- start:12 stop:143 length:132 start_codon:yes stop_codon:yes gene_type:complete
VSPEVGGVKTVEPFELLRVKLDLFAVVAASLPALLPAVLAATT